MALDEITLFSLNQFNPIPKYSMNTGSEKWNF